MSIKSELINYYYERRADFEPEETDTVLEILDGYNDNLTGLGQLDAQLLCRLLEDSALIEKVQALTAPESTGNLFD